MREAALELGGLKAKVVDIEAHCMQRTFEMIRNQFFEIDEEDEDDDKVIAVVDIGATMTTLSPDEQWCTLHEGTALWRQAADRRDSATLLPLCRRSGSRQETRRFTGRLRNRSTPAV